MGAGWKEVYPYIPPLLQGDWVRVREKEVAQPCRYNAQLCRTDSCLVNHYLLHVKVEQAALEKRSLHFEGEALTGFTFQIILAHHWFQRMHQSHALIHWFVPSFPEHTRVLGCW